MIFSNNEAMWQFSSIDNIEEPLFNRSLERFKEMGVSGLTRENIQNSLDGKLPGSNMPVIVKIETGEIYEKDIPGINYVKQRVDNLRGFNKYTKETIEHMKNKLDQKLVRYISFEDINTKGLTGARNGQCMSEKDTWSIYAYNKGVHFEEDDERIETARGGSHGVGKIASNAASDLHVMYFANCDEFGDQHLGGTVQLIEHEFNGQAYRSTGYFTKVKYENDKTKYYPFENNFHDVFKKDSRGLKIVIPYLRKEYDNEREIIRSVCDSFFVSILNEKLIVFVNDKKISKDTILDYVRNEEYYNQEITEAKKDFTPLYVETYLESPTNKIVVNNIVEDFHFDLYFRYDERIPRGRVAVVRTIGMKIEDFRVKNNATKPFNAVLIGGPKEDAYLKSLENESHTKLSKDHINDEKLKKYATRFINNLSNEIAKIIDKAIRENNETDGLMDTGDILYVLETQFKEDLKNSIGTVRVKGGKTLVKSGGSDSKRERRDKRKGKAGNPRVAGRRKKKRDPLKWNKTDTESGNKSEQQERYSAHPEMVDRIILADKEILRFDFTNSKKIKGITKCDISLSVIDGMGKEYNDEFKIHDNYLEVIDLNSGKVCNFEKEYIRNVQINDGVAQLELHLRKDFNPSLKFVYYVEV